jgi:hypothetical protein
MEKVSKEKLILPATVVLACLIVGGFLFAIQVSKQRSIEKQAVLKIESETKKQEDEKQSRQSCYEEAGIKSRELLKKKTVIYPDDTEFKKGVENDLYLRDDFAEYYEQCLSKNGLQK